MPFHVAGMAGIVVDTKSFACCLLIEFVADVSHLINVGFNVEDG